MGDYRNNYSRHNRKGCGTYTTMENAEGFWEPKPFIMREKAKDMMAATYKMLFNFPRKYRAMSDDIKDVALKICDYTSSLEIHGTSKRKVLTELDIANKRFQILIDIASSKDICINQNEVPPVKLEQRHKLSMMSEELGRMIGGYSKSLDAEKVK